MKDSNAALLSVAIDRLDERRGVLTGIRDPLHLRDSGEESDAHTGLDFRHDAVRLSERIVLQDRGKEPQDDENSYYVRNGWTKAQRAKPTLKQMPRDR